MEDALVCTPTIISSDIEKKKTARELIFRVQDNIAQMPGAMFGDCFPLKHTFADGVYVREITCPKGALVVTKIHKVCHPYFLLKGECSVLTEEGVKRIKAPYSGITPAGCKRVVFCHDDVIWTTVHVTKETDVDKIEEEIIAKDFTEIDQQELNQFIIEAQEQQIAEV